MGQPADYDMLHRSFVRSLRAENAAPRTIEAYTLAVERLREYLAGMDAELDATDGSAARARRGLPQRPV